MKINKNKILSLLKKTIAFFVVFFISFLIAQSICYFILDDIVFIFFTGLIQYILLRLFITITLFISIGYLLQWDFIHKHILKIFVITYILLLFTVTLKPQRDHLMNLNILSMFEDMDIDALAKPLLIGNILMYIPLGYLINVNLNLKFITKIISGIVFIFSIELIQFIFRLGVFDINDILLNTLGLLIGVFLYEIYIRIRKALERPSKPVSL